MTVANIAIATQHETIIATITPLEKTSPAGANFVESFVLTIHVVGLNPWSGLIKFLLSDNGVVRVDDVRDDIDTIILFGDDVRDDVDTIILFGDDFARFLAVSVVDEIRPIKLPVLKGELTLAD